MTEASGPRGMVLVVEDDPSVTQVLRFTMRRAGFDFMVVASGEEALRELDRPGVAVVVLDLGLPDGMSGAVLARLRETESGGASAPALLVMSALDLSEAEARYGPLGGRFVAKPFDAWELVRRIEKLLETPTEERPGQA